MTTVVSIYMVEKGMDMPEMKNIKNGGMYLNVKCMIQILLYLHTRELGIIVIKYQRPVLCINTK